MRVWELIDLKCRIALERFPLSLDEYTQILEKDKVYNDLTFNERNAILFRKKQMEMYIEIHSFATSIKLFEMRL